MNTTIIVKNTHNQLYKQQGVVLIVALVFLIALTAVAAALMQNTTTDIKMASASQEKSVVTQETISEMEQIIFNEVRRVDGENEFSKIITGEVTLTPIRVNTTANLVSANQYGFDVECPRAIKGTSTGTLKCSIKRVQVNRTYGRNSNHIVQVNSGIAQVVITNTGN